MERNKTGHKMSGKFDTYNYIFWTDVRVMISFNVSAIIARKFVAR